MTKAYIKVWSVNLLSAMLFLGSSKSCDSFRFIACYKVLLHNGKLDQLHVCQREENFINFCRCFLFLGTHAKIFQVGDILMSRHHMSRLGQDF